MDLIDRACEAMRSIGVEPVITPVRGGTDGCHLSYAGLPCPNLFTGGHNYHGKYEYIVRESMEKSVELLLALARK
jgi:tripeptide aminopeptidase